MCVGLEPIAVPYTSQWICQSGERFGAKFGQMQASRLLKDPLNLLFMLTVPECSVYSIAHCFNKTALLY